MRLDFRVSEDRRRQSGEWRETQHYLGDSSLATRRSKFHRSREAWLTGPTSHSEPCDAQEGWRVNSNVNKENIDYKIADAELGSRGQIFHRSFIFSYSTWLQRDDVTSFLACGHLAEELGGDVTFWAHCERRAGAFKGNFARWYDHRWKYRIIDSYLFANVWIRQTDYFINPTRILSYLYIFCYKVYICKYE